MKIHLGREISAMMKKRGITAEDMAERLDMDKSNVYNIFRRAKLDAELLAMLSRELDYNFFELFDIPSKNSITLLITLDGSDLQQRIVMLSKVNEIIQKSGINQ